MFECLKRSRYSDDSDDSDDERESEAYMSKAQRADRTSRADPRCDSSDDDVKDYVDSEAGEDDDDSEAGEDDEDDEDGLSACADEIDECDMEILQQIVLNQIRDSAEQFQTLLVERTGCTKPEICAFRACAHGLRSIYSLGMYDRSPKDNAGVLLDIVGKMGFAHPDITPLNNEVWAAFCECLGPLQYLDLERRAGFVRSIVETLPQGGVLCKLMLHPRAALASVVCVHAIQSARTLRLPVQQSATDFLSIIFGGADATTDEMRDTFCVSMADALLSTRSRVDEWVTSINKLSDEAFFRRVVLNINQLATNPRFLRRALRYNDPKLPIFMGRNDDVYTHHAEKVAKAASLRVIRVELRIDDANVDNRASTLGIDLQKYRLRRMGGSLFWHRVEAVHGQTPLLISEGGVASMAMVSDSVPVPSLGSRGARAQRIATMTPLLIKAFQKPQLRQSLLRLGFDLSSGLPVPTAASGEWVITLRKASTRRIWKGAPMALLTDRVLIGLSENPEQYWPSLANGLYTMQIVPRELVGSSRIYYGD